MMRLPLSEMEDLLGARLVGKDGLICSVTADPGMVSGEGCLFVPPWGGDEDRVHRTVARAVRRGATAVMFDRRLELEIPQLIVRDTGEALGVLATLERRRSVGTRFIALTGSSGKTSVREMLSSVLSQNGSVLSSLGNLNGRMGVPLTLLRLDDRHDFAVVELGADRPGEISRLAGLVMPDVVLVNNVAESHLEGFGSLDGVARSKGEIFTQLAEDGCAVFNADSNDWVNWRDLVHGRSWSFSTHLKDSANFFAADVELGMWHSRFMLHTPVGRHLVHLPLPGLHSVSNALAVAALSFAVGVDLSSVVSGLSRSRSVPGRLFPITIGEGKLLIDDSYNSNVGSMMAAVDVMLRMDGHKVLVVGDMAELGSQAICCHRKLGCVISSTDIDQILTVGSLSRFISQHSSRGRHFVDIGSLVSYLLDLISGHDRVVVLVKGSRRSAMERVVRAVRERYLC